MDHISLLFEVYLYIVVHMHKCKRLGEEVVAKIHDMYEQSYTLSREVICILM